VSQPISPFRLEQAMSEAMKLRELVGDDDAALLVGTLEGETDIMVILDRLAEHAVADHLLAERGRERIKRLEAREERARDTIRRIMEALGIAKLERPLVSLSVTDGPRAVVITDQAAVPEGWWRRAIDKVALAKHLKAGNTVPGAELANGQPVLRLTSR
jgi:hypothetical protein